MPNKKTPANAWQPGQSGNPAGRPKGARHKATMMVLALMEDGAKEIAETIIQRAKEGDLGAARLVLDRLAPPARERPIALDGLPDTSTAAGVAEATRAVLEAVAAGDLTPGEGATVAGILEGRRKALETQELEARIAALEARK